MAEPFYLSTPTGKKIRILGPFDYDQLVQKISRANLRTLFNVCFWSGMRYVEVQRLHLHPEWWLKERQALHLPREASLKKKRTIPERYVPVPPQLASELPYFFQNPAPMSLQGWRDNLLRWAWRCDWDEAGITPKMTRATIESWMYAAGLEPGWICLRQGHDSITSMNHYRGIPFTDAEKSEIRKRLAGWS